MIEFHHESKYELENTAQLKHWLGKCAALDGFSVGDVNYILCDDDYLHRMNLTFLNHDTLTDVIGFDRTVGKRLQGDIFISTERVMENATEFGVDNDSELRRVMIHGLLHFMGYNDKTPGEAGLMRDEENEMLSMFHVEQF